MNIWRFGLKEFNWFTLGDTDDTANTKTPAQPFSNWLHTYEQPNSKWFYDETQQIHQEFSGKGLTKGHIYYQVEAKSC